MRASRYLRDYDSKGGVQTSGPAKVEKFQGEGMDWDPQQYSFKERLISQLDPRSSAKMLAASLQAQAGSYDPSMTPAIRDAFRAQAAGVGGGANLSELQQMRGSGGGMSFDRGGVAPPMGGGGAKFSSFQTQNPQAELARALSQERKMDQRADADYAYQQKMKGLDLQARQTEVGDMEGQKKREMLMRVLGML
jgi:hypothetical protein